MLKFSLISDVDCVYLLMGSVNYSIILDLSERPDVKMTRDEGRDVDGRDLVEQKVSSIFGCQWQHMLVLHIFFHIYSLEVSFKIFFS